MKYKITKIKIKDDSIININLDRTKADLSISKQSCAIALSDSDSLILQTGTDVEIRALINSLLVNSSLVSLSDTEEEGELDDEINDRKINKQIIKRQRADAVKVLKLSGDLPASFVDKRK